MRCVPISALTTAGSTDSAIWNLRDRRDAQRRCQPVSPRRDPARSPPRRAGPARPAHGRARRAARSPGDGRRAAGERGDRLPGRGAAVSHHRRARVLRGLLTLGPVIAPDDAVARQAARPAARSLRPGGTAALATARAPGHEPHDDEDGHRDQPDDEKHLERCQDPARDGEGKPDSEDRAEDCPDDPAHVPSMPPRPWQATVALAGDFLLSLLNAAQVKLGGETLAADRRDRRGARARAAPTYRANSPGRSTRC